MSVLFLYSASDVTAGDEIESFRVLDRVEEKLDALEVESPFQAEILESMSRIYRQRGLYAEARPPLERALAIRQRLAPDRKLALTLNELASLHSRLGNKEEAESLRRQAEALSSQADLCCRSKPPVGSSRTQQR